MNLSSNELLSIPYEQVHELAPLGNKNFRGVSTDSRTTKRGDLFIAIRGETFDGHQFLGKAFTQGAYAAIVDKKWFSEFGKTSKFPLLIVENTLDAYGALANVYRRKFSIPILVVAGSNGKTTTKDLLGHVLSTNMEVLKTEANYNNQIGLPRMLLQLRDGHEIAVLEIGTNHPGEIGWLVNVAEPTHAIVTNIGREHLEFFKNLKGVAAEEMTAFSSTAKRGGCIFVNLDDEYLAPAATKYSDLSVTYGSTPEASVSASRIGFGKDGRLELRVTLNGKSFKLRTHLIADYAPNLVAGVSAVANKFGMRRTEIKLSIEQFRPKNKRLEIVHLPGEITVLNDAYNANPDSMESSFRTFTEFPSTGKKYVVLGDMFELGSTSASEHRALGKKIALYPFDRVFFTGKEMKLTFKTYSEALGVEQDRGAASRGAHYPTKEEISKELRQILMPGDALLVKGSRGMRMEEIIDLLQRP